jgi:ubiquinone/menaquinone biosynthesis C-methylase UbiE
MLNGLKFAMMPVWRRRRMDAFLRIMRPKRGARILDVGGVPYLTTTVPGMWQLVNSDFKVTLLNLAGSFSHYEPRELQQYNLIKADACDFPSLNDCFDIVFSNSVIEHVGGIEQQQKFARFVMTAGHQYWVQTPSPTFPLEAHCNLPFWWFYPKPARTYFLRRWERNPSLQRSLADAYADTANSGNGPLTLSRVAILYAGWKTWALGFGITKMCGYEGGYSPDFTGISQVDKLRAASKLAPSLSDFTVLNYKNFVGLSDSGFTAEFPSCFQLSGGNPENNAWSVLDDVYQAPNSPQWDAIVKFNH